MYRVSSYFWSKMLTTLPTTLAYPILIISVIYFAIGFNTENWYKFPVLICVGVLEYVCFGALGLVIGAAVSDPVIINILTPVLIVPMMLFSGFFVNQDNFPWFLTPFEYLSIHKYGYQAFFLNEYEGLDLECMRETDPLKVCNPIDDFAAPQTFMECIWAMLGLTLGFGALSYWCLSSKSK